jgi:hypothetical protein
MEREDFYFVGECKTIFDETGEEGRAEVAEVGRGRGHRRYRLSRISDCKEVKQVSVVNAVVVYFVVNVAADFGLGFDVVVNCFYLHSVDVRHLFITS